MAGLYVHIPFCRSRCVYCGFYSTTFCDLQSAYIDALKAELTLRSDYLSEPIRTIYIGGGTPSVLSDDNLKRLFEAISDFSGGFSSVEEITIECNPDDISRSKVLLLREIGATRVSMGVQTFNSNHLRFLRRRHSSQQAISAYQILRDGGFRNISLDLMFGFPNQTLSEWQRDLDQILLLRPEHISAYSLMIEENTPLYDMVDRAKVSEIDEDLSRWMYEMLVKDLSAAGYEHYEISNFAMSNTSSDRSMYRSLHNSNYWTAVPYMGIGAAAHSYNICSRQWNVADVRQYITAISSGKVPFECEELDVPTRYNDLVTTAMRTKEGISQQFIIDNFGQQYADYLLAAALPHIEKGLLKEEKGRISLTHDGIFVSDSIMTDLIFVG